MLRRRVRFLWVMLKRRVQFCNHIKMKNWFSSVSHVEKKFKSLIHRKKSSKILSDIFQKKSSSHLFFLWDISKKKVQFLESSFQELNSVKHIEKKKVLFFESYFFKRVQFFDSYLKKVLWVKLKKKFNSLSRLFHKVEFLKVIFYKKEGSILWVVVFFFFQEKFQFFESLFQEKSSILWVVF